MPVSKRRYYIIDLFNNYVIIAIRGLLIHTYIELLFIDIMPCV